MLDPDVRRVLDGTSIVARLMAEQHGRHRILYSPDNRRSRTTTSWVAYTGRKRTPLKADHRPSDEVSVPRGMLPR